VNAHDRSAPARPRRSAARAQEDAVVARLSALATALDDEPDPAFRTATRDRLVAMAAVRTPEPAPRPRLRRLLAVRADGTAARPWRTRVTAGLAGAALTVTALGSLVALAADARPGDALYALKRGTEQTQLALAGDDRGLTLLQFAATRLEELVELPDSGAAGVVVDLLDTMDAQTAEGTALLATRAVDGRDAAPLDELAAWAARQSTRLAALGAGIPTGATPDLRESSDLLAAVGTRAADLQAALDCASGPATDGTDALGPVPVPCPAGVTDPAPPAPAPSAPDPSAPAPSAPATEAGRTVPGGPAGEPSIGDAGPAPSATPAPGGPPDRSGSGSTGSPGPAAEPPSASPQPPAAGRPSIPSLPIPLPPVVGAPGTPSPSPAPARPPLIDTPLPICIPPLVC
jgi:hypothetical protein